MKAIYITLQISSRAILVYKLAGENVLVLEFDISSIWLI